ncbi:fatty acid--CoA ligase [Pseudomonas sp. BN417]|uniref:class I adenylate-forming enzyme family protein n=1 Tax=Pseudomonas sp. BN417 TaxID=2567890 RepID=UPI002454A63A|nr:AMP-binding protein [Pseudomonas sp. BN417]MDH4554059.1 fatty acid--CoA ligase [Pseudomonas sp. BN417]
MTKTTEWFEVSPIGDLIVRGAHLQPARDAIVFPEERRTYRQLCDNAIQVARGLIALGVRPGQHVGLMSANCPEFIEGFLGAVMLGCVAVPINARHKASEIGYIIQNANLVALLTTADDNEYTNFTALFCDALPSLPKAVNPAALVLPEVLCLRSTVLLKGECRKGFVGRSEFDRLAQSIDANLVHEARLRVRIRDLALLVYTSGTTANPKGCMLTHEAIVRGSVQRARSRFATGEHHVAWNPGPLFHIAAIAPFLGVIGTLGTYLTDTFFEPGRAITLMEREGVSMAWPWFPAIVQGVLDHPDFDAGKLASLRKIMLIGPPALVKKVQKTFPDAELFQACGMTETAGIFALTDAGETAEQRANTQGRPAVGMEVRISSLDGKGDAAPGEVGEILVRGFCVMEGYYRDPEKTADTLDKDGWLHTGDLYLRTEDGSLVFNGRLKDMLKVGGENVAAIEIESYLCEHPCVAIAEVVGKPDPRLDEVPVAFVELKPGKTVDAEELIAFCKGKIANFKVPRAVHFVEPGTWPMSATKVNKRALRSMLTD